MCLFIIIFAGLQDRVSLAGSEASVDYATECLETNNVAAAAAAGPVGETNPSVATQSARVPVPVQKPSNKLSEQQIPALSYSSSDDDDFFDADEYQDDMR